MNEIIKKQQKTIPKFLQQEPLIKFRPKIRSVYQQTEITGQNNFQYNITTPGDYPECILEGVQSKDKTIEIPENSKLLKIALFGPTNSGKSQLLNYLCGQFISAYSNKSFTTQYPKVGINTNQENKTQIIFYDLPSFQQYDNGFRFYQKQAFKGIQNQRLDLIGIVIDGTKNISNEVLRNLEITTKKFGNECDFFLIVNKMDLCYNRRKLQDSINIIEGKMNFIQKFYSSAQSQYGKENILQFLQEQAKQKKWLYSKEVKYLSSELDLVEEKFKSIVYQRFYKEFPYTLQTKITQFLVQNDKIKISAVLYCLKKIHKGMLIGKKGKIVELIKNFVEKEMIIFLGKKVEIELEVSDGISFNNLETQKITNEEVLTSEKQQLSKKKEDLKKKFKQFYFNNDKCKFYQRRFIKLNRK